MSSPRRWFVRIGKLLGGTVVAVALAEVLVRLHNPLILTVRGDKIVLPANVSLEIENPGLPGIDAEINYSRNSIGFRGSEPPPDLTHYLSLITVGGSTTECLFLSDDQTWPSILERKLNESFRDVWINNAGLDGHSTVGHVILTADYLVNLRPKIILLFAGLNDLFLSSPTGNPADQSLLEPSGGEAYPLRVLRGWSPDAQRSALVTRVARYSELVAFLQTLLRYQEAKRAHAVHRAIDLKSMRHWEPAPGEFEGYLASLQGSRVGFEERLTKIYDLTKAAGIELILVTQPVLWAAEVDDVTGVRIATIPNVRAIWLGLELFNEVTREVGKRHDLLVIDLAAEMPKSSRYYYDGMHFTKIGALEVADILYRKLCPHLRERYAEELVGTDCHLPSP